MSVKRPASQSAKVAAFAAGLSVLGSIDIGVMAAGLAVGVAFAAWSYAPSPTVPARRKAKPPGRNALAFAAGALAVFALAILVTALPGPAQEPGAHGTGARAASTYKGVEYCLKCHGPGGTGGDQYTGWRATAHGADFSNITHHGVSHNLFTEQDGLCQPCHVAGYNLTDMNGFDPARPYDSGNNSLLLGVQCENCHGPGSDLCEECHGPPSDHSQEATNLVEKPSPEQSCAGGFSGSACHGPGGRDIYTSWAHSMHSPADQREQALPQGLNTYCARCKSPSQYDPVATASNSTAIPVDKWRGVECADCHDSHGNRYEGQLKAPPDELCGGCHNSEYAQATPGEAPLHPQKEMFLGRLGANVTGTKGMPGTTCAGCHGWNTPGVAPGVDLSGIAGYPYPMHERHRFTATPEACADCHSTLLMGMPNVTRPADAMGANAMPYAAWEKWMPAWLGEVEKWNSTVRAWQSETAALTGEAGPIVAAARAAIDSAAANGTKDPAAIAEASALWGDAFWNYNLVVNDKSDGVHNHDFALALLRDALAKSEGALALMEANSIPVADAGRCQAAATGQVLVFDGSRSFDRDGVIVSSAWDLGDGSSASGIVARHEYADDGLYHVKLTVVDDRGAEASAWTVVQVHNRPPRAVAGGERSAASGETLRFDASASSDPDGTVAGWGWDFGDGGSAAGPAVEHCYASPGVYVVFLTVIDDDGAPGTDAAVVRVAGPVPSGNLPPVAIAGSDRSTAAGNTVLFDGTGSYDPDGSVVSYVWSFGDGTTGAGATTGHSFAAAGVYAVVLSVTDDDGSSGFDVALVEAAAALPPPPDLAALEQNISALADGVAGARAALASAKNDTAQMGRDISRTRRSLDALSGMMQIGPPAILCATSALASALYVINLRRTETLSGRLAGLRRHAGHGGTPDRHRHIRDAGVVEDAELDGEGDNNDRGNVL